MRIEATYWAGISCLTLYRLWHAAARILRHSCCTGCAIKLLPHCSAEPRVYASVPALPFPWRNPGRPQPLRWSFPCRVGYGAFPLGLIEYLWRAKQPYNVSVAAEVCLAAVARGPHRMGLCGGDPSEHGGKPSNPPAQLVTCRDATSTPYNAPSTPAFPLMPTGCGTGCAEQPAVH